MTRKSAIVWLTASVLITWAFALWLVHGAHDIIKTSNAHDVPPPTRVLFVVLGCAVLATAASIVGLTFTVVREILKDLRAKRSSERHLRGH